jgi:cytochrome c-type biogenesis protein CcmH/NrfF
LKSFFLIPAKRIPALLALLLTATVLFGAGDNPVRIERLGHQLMCACGCNQILLECNHVGCAYSTSMRSELVAEVGKDNDKGVLQWFVEKYGPTVLAAPPTTGFNRLAWIMPYLALVMGIAAIIWIVNVWRARSPATASLPVSGQEPSELERFREQVRKEADL